LKEKKALVIYASHADFQHTVTTPGMIGFGTGGFPDTARDRVDLPLPGLNADIGHVISHDLGPVCELYLTDSPSRCGRRASQLPMWMIEGLAECLSQGRVDPATALWMRDAVLHGLLPDPEKLIQRQPSPYQYGQAIWAYVAGRWDDRTVALLFRRALEAGPAAAFQSVLGVEIGAFLADFHEALAAAAAPVLESRAAPADTAEPLLTAATTGASVNIAPSLSPDGTRVAFLST